MAIGLSGSSGGIGTYRELVKIDIEAGIEKYKNWQMIVQEPLVKRFYGKIVDELENFLLKINDSKLEKTLEGL